MAANDLPVIENDPSAGWGAKLQPKSAISHKYDHGHVVIFGGRRMTGAGALAAIAALRMGAGLTTVVSHPEVANVYRQASLSLIVEELDQMARFRDHIQDERRNAVVIGPGAGHENPGALKKAVLDAVQMNKICVLDADALTVFQDDMPVLLRVTGPNCVLTPHEGEFERIFPDIKGPRADRAQAAALKTRSIIVLKGHETIIASPEGGCMVNTTGNGWLATAGTGDVLAGMIAGLAARNLEGLSLFGAVCASVWMHGTAADRFGAGLLSSDLPAELPALWVELLAKPAKRSKAKAA